MGVEGFFLFFLSLFLVLSSQSCLNQSEASETDTDTSELFLFSSDGGG